MVRSAAEIDDESTDDESDDKHDLQCRKENLGLDYLRVSEECLSRSACPEATCRRTNLSV